MTNKRSTRRALLTSVLVLVLCISMFVGTTFAWFTDSVTSAGNKIVAGNLKIDLEMLVENDDGTTTWTSLKESKDPIFTYENWEPGYTEVKILKVENEGSLALKWKAMFVSLEKLTALADVIDVYVCPSETELAYPNSLDGYTLAGTVTDFVNTIQQTTYGDLEANECAYLGIALKMQETAGNEYQSLGLGAFDLRIVATQQTSEDDSFGNTYDADAAYTSEIDNLRAALAAANVGDTVSFTLSHDAYISTGIVVPNGVKLELDGAGHTLYAADSTAKPNGLLTLNAGTVKNLNVVADAGVDGVASPRALYINALTSDVVVENCSFRGGYALNVNTNNENYGFTAKNSTFDGWTSISAIKSASFEDCTFTGKYDNDYFGAMGYSGARVRPYCDTTYTRCAFTGDVLYDAGKEGITIAFENCTTDGEAVTPFNFFDRTTSSELANLVGCTITIDGESIEKGVLAFPDTVQGLIDAGNSVIYLASGKYDDAILAKSGLTIIGTPGAVVDVINLNGANGVTIKNVEFDAAGAEAAYDSHSGGTRRSYANIMGASKNGNVGARNIVIDGCTFTGKFENAGAAIAFADRSRKTGGSGNVTIKNCTFDTENANYDVYGYYTGPPGYTFTFENNTFSSECRGQSIYLGRLKTSEAIIVKGNTFVKASDASIYVAGDTGYTPTVDATNNTFAN